MTHYKSPPPGQKPAGGWLPRNPPDDKTFHEELRDVWVAIASSASRREGVRRASAAVDWADRITAEYAKRFHGGLGSEALDNIRAAIKEYDG